jgi:hypothetical protein
MALHKRGAELQSWHRMYQTLGHRLFVSKAAGFEGATAITSREGTTHVGEYRRDCYRAGSLVARPWASDREIGPKRKLVSSIEHAGRLRGRSFLGDRQTVGFHFSRQRNELYVERNVPEQGVRS